MATETILKRISTKDKEAFMKMVEESNKVVDDKPAKTGKEALTQLLKK